MTNNDRINAMSVEEKVEWINLMERTLGCNCCAFQGTNKCNGLSCRKGLKKWLESEVEE